MLLEVLDRCLMVGLSGHHVPGDGAGKPVKRSLDRIGEEFKECLPSDRGNRQGTFGAVKTEPRPLPAGDGRGRQLSGGD